PSNVTPLSAVMLVLLIVFMVFTPMLQNKVNIELAKVTDPTSMPDADKEDAVVVAITRDNKVYLGKTRSPWRILALKWPICCRTKRKSRFLCVRTPARSTAQSWMPLMMSAPLVLT